MTASKIEWTDATGRSTVEAGVHETERICENVSKRSAFRQPVEPATIRSVA
jgi:hypothetical protein